MTEQDGFTTHPREKPDLSETELSEPELSETELSEKSELSRQPSGENPDGASTDRAILRLETRLARAEAQVLGLQEAMADVHVYFRTAKQRALYLRIALLVAALAAFLYLRYSGSPG